MTSAKDLYERLGVPSDAAPGRIRDAYRRLARRHHPDVAGAEATARFQDIAEAYGVLSDEGRRRAYDRSRRDTTPVGVQPLPRRDAAAHGSRGPVLELVLDEEEAARGGFLTVPWPLARPCSRCRGRATDDLLGCPACRGHGHVVVEEPLRFRLPPGLAAGDVVWLAPAGPAGPRVPAVVCVAQPRSAGSARPRTAGTGSVHGVSR